MSTYYGPVDESYADIVTERYFLAGDLLAGVGYGMIPVLSSPFRTTHDLALHRNAGSFVRGMCSLPLEANLDTSICSLHARLHHVTLHC